MGASLDTRFRPPAEYETAILAVCARLLPVISDAGRNCGYAIGVHGSMKRDLDIIAAPWVEAASDADTLTKVIRDAIVAHVGQAFWRVHDKVGPHGRRWATILLAGDVGISTPAGLFPFVDLSIMARATVERENT